MKYCNESDRTLFPKSLDEETICMNFAFDSIELSGFIFNTALLYLAAELKLLLYKLKAVV